MDDLSFQVRALLFNSGQPQAARCGPQRFGFVFSSSGGNRRPVGWARWWHGLQPVNRHRAQPPGEISWLCFFESNPPQAGSVAPKRWLCFFRSVIRGQAAGATRSGFDGFFLCDLCVFARKKKRTSRKDAKMPGVSQSRSSTGRPPWAATVWLCFFRAQPPQAGSIAPKRWLCFFRSAVRRRAAGRGGGLGLFFHLPVAIASSFDRMGFPMRWRTFGEYGRLASGHGDPIPPNSIHR
jgi:hypothetical protein